METFVNIIGYGFIFIVLIGVAWGFVVILGMGLKALNNNDD
jgi:hypothetical protein